MSTTTPEKSYNCAICTGPFEKRYFGRPVCGPVCNSEWIRQKRLEKVKREQRKTDKGRKEKLKTKSEHLAEAQTVFNKYIRLRDRLKPCISCDTTTAPQYCAGHYRSIGACPELRFSELNVHKQCNKFCNMSKSGNILEYRIRLIDRIGVDNVEWLEGPHEPLKLTIEDIKEIKIKYRNRCQALEAARFTE